MAQANSQTHRFTELCYKKARFAWGGDRSQRACWFLPEAEPSRGEVLVEGIRAPIGQQIKKVDGVLSEPAMRKIKGHKDISYTKGGKREW